MEPGEALSSAESAAKNNVHVKFYSTDSSRFYVCHSLLYPSCSHFILGGTTVRIFRHGRRRQHLSFGISRRVLGSSSAELEIIFYDDARLRDVMQLETLSRTVCTDQCSRNYQINKGFNAICSDFLIFCNNFCKK